MDLLERTLPMEPELFLEAKAAPDLSCNYRETANPDQLLPAGRTWAICFRTTANALRGFLIKRGRTFQEWTFGMYDDGRTPMYTLIRINPRE